ncbi:MAG: histidinol-phosphatase [Erysipelotrichaceae bacterium]|nr:histidinol-phosphatase [Erysipelotrichaceae bacterium]
MKFNYHTHTARCGHATGTDEEYVHCAIEAGYQILGFSDHAPYRNYPNRRIHMDWDQLDDYIESIEFLKEKYRDQIEIHLGLESEYYPYLHEEKVELRNKVEYLMLGQHFSDPVGSQVDYFRQNSEEEIMLYGTSICEALDTGLFNCLCHPDVIMSRQPVFTDACETIAHMVGKKCSEKDIPVEVNVRGIMKGKRRPIEGKACYYPSKEFWTVLAQYPLRVIVGIDAHAPEDLLDQESVNDAYKMLEDLHLNCITEPLL